jgi:hypothetical protein
MAKYWKKIYALFFGKEGVLPQVLHVDPAIVNAAREFIMME